MLNIDDYIDDVCKIDNLDNHIKAVEKEAILQAEKEAILQANKEKEYDDYIDKKYSFLIKRLSKWV